MKQTASPSSSPPRVPPPRIDVDDPSLFRKRVGNQEVLSQLTRIYYDLVSQLSKEFGGTSIPAPSLPTPSPILHSFNSHFSQLISSGHQDWSLEVLYVHPFCDLPIETAFMNTGHLHGKIHVSPVVVMVCSVELED